MLESTKDLFSGRLSGKSLDVSDTRMFVQGWFREKTKSEGVYCEGVSGGTATIRVSTPALHQQVRLLESEFLESVRIQEGVEIERLTIRT